MAKKRARKNRSPQENEAITDKISKLQQEGLPRDRATAAAFRMFRAGELETKSALKLTKAQRKKRQELRFNALQFILGTTLSKRQVKPSKRPAATRKTKKN